MSLVVVQVFLRRTGETLFVKRTKHILSTWLYSETPLPLSTWNHNQWFDSVLNVFMRGNTTSLWLPEDPSDAITIAYQRFSPPHSSLFHSPARVDTPQVPLRTPSSRKHPWLSLAGLLAALRAVSHIPEVSCHPVPGTQTCPLWISW